MLDVGILHHDLEWPERQLAECLAVSDMRISLLDVRQVAVDQLWNLNVILNRVYASVANRDFASVKRALELVSNAERAGILCLNCRSACQSDYDKFYAYQCMQSAGVATPHTECIEVCNEDQATQAIREFLQTYGSPMIVKRNTGGRGKDVMLVKSEVECRAVAHHAVSQSPSYTGEWILQCFARNVRSYDCRIAVACGRYVDALTRSLVRRHSSDPFPWLASWSCGSSCSAYSPTAAEIDLALAATKSIGADLNEVDISVTERGPVVIENNPTPQFVSDLDSERLPRLVALINSRIRAKSQRK